MPTTRSPSNLMDAPKTGYEYNILTWKAELLFRRSAARFLISWTCTKRFWICTFASRYRILKSHTAFSCSWLFPGYRNFYKNLCRNSMLSAVLSNAAVMHLFPEPGSLVHHLTISRLKPAHCYAALIMPSASATLGMPHKVLQILHVLQYSCQIYAAVT